MQRDTDLEAVLVAKYAALGDFLDERSRRLWAATESRAIGYGGDALVSAATGIARATIRKGRRELEIGRDSVDGRVRRPGAGRPRLEDAQQGLLKALEALVEPVTRGDPTSPLRWTCKSKAKLAAALSKQGWKVSATTVGRMLHELGYSLQSVRKTREGTTHPDRNEQFEYINAMATRFLKRGQPVVSVDTKKKELVGDFKNAGKEWQPKGEPDKALVHDFPDDAIGKAESFVKSRRAGSHRDRHGIASVRSSAGQRAAWRRAASCWTDTTRGLRCSVPPRLRFRSSSPSS
jgi:transposase